jgi:hypothetical protein
VLWCGQVVTEHDGVVAVARDDSSDGTPSWPEMIVVTEHDGVVVVKNRLRQWPEMIVVTEHDGVVVVDRVHTDGACNACCALDALAVLNVQPDCCQGIVRFNFTLKRHDGEWDEFGGAEWDEFGGACVGLHGHVGGRGRAATAFTTCF